MTARERLAYYASAFPLTEVTTTYRFPPTPELAAQWAERTPPGFTFDVRAWSLLSGAPTLPSSLWPDLHDQIRARSRDRRRLYAAHLSDEALAECWARFAHALGPLRAAGRLGVVTVGYPGWFTPREEAWAELASLAGRLPGCQVAVDLHNPRWFAGEACDRTLEWLEDHGLGFLCVEDPEGGPAGAPAVVAATSEVAMVRLAGRRATEVGAWEPRHRYPIGRLEEWVPRIADLAESSSAVHVVFDNAWRADAVADASELRRLLAAT